jgi:Cu2+-exporting ATPase
MISHELPQRIRLRSRILKNRDLDPDYFEASLEGIPGVTGVRLNTQAACVIVRYDGLNKTRTAVLSRCADLPRELFNGRGGYRSLNSILSVAGRGALALSVLFLPPLIAAPLSLVLAVPILVDGVMTLWARGIKVEVLDASAVTFCLVRRDFFTAATIVFMLSIGRYLEELSEDKTTGLLKSLLKPQVDKIWIEIDGQELEIDRADARIGDRVICGVGEMVPLDGVVVSGEASVNQSSITGESVPVHVEPGTEVLSGAVVEDGRIVFEANRIGAETSMARIGSFLENSLRYQSESQKKSDELADKLVPVTFGLGLGLLAVTWDLTKAAAVLTVDYSCAVKLANPVAVRVSMYTAAHEGVLLKGSQAMDGLARIDTLIFDKTGTLTKGRLTVTDTMAFNGMGDRDLLSLAASAEEHYSHPAAKAILQAARDAGLTLPPTSKVGFIVAHGVSAYIDDHHVLVGSRHFTQEDEGIDCSAADNVVNRLQEQGKSLLYVARDEKLAGIIGLRDELRPEAANVLAALKETGIEKIVILSGDSKLTARALAARLPAVDEVHWELKPEDKAAIVTRLQESGHTIAFAGDGVNDAPALVTADVGICMPGGADLARESAQVILMRDDLYGLLAARQIALRNQQTIKRSFFSAVGLNTVFLLLATFGIVQPITAAVLHNTSTVGILGYSGWAGSRKSGCSNKENSEEEK